MYLSISIIAILGKVAKLINAKREKKPNPEHPHALKSLEEVMKLIGPDTHHHAVHVSANYLKKDRKIGSILMHLNLA
jgi:hypothetical protein